MISNKGLNSNEALDESTATNSSVTLSGIRRVKEAPDGLDITYYSRNPGNSDPHCISAAPAALDRYLAAVPAMSLVPLAPFAKGYSESFDSLAPAHFGLSALPIYVARIPAAPFA